MIPSLLNIPLSGLASISRLLSRRTAPAAAPKPQAPADVVFSGIVKDVAPFTMVHESGVQFAAEQAIAVIEGGIPGVIVECGVWRGGCSMAMLMAQQERFGHVERTVYMLDSFAGLPPVDDRDGPLARQWQTGAQSDRFFDNCLAAERDLRGALAVQGFAEPEFRIHAGWFCETLPQVVAEAGPGGIALLRLDCDWYEPTMECLEALEPLVSEGGTIILDDYYAWDGFARATHDYLSRHDLPYRIKSLPYNFGAYLVKQACRKSFEVL